MIIREQENRLIMIRQHDHAIVSGEIAAAWHPDFFFDTEKKEAVVYGVAEHDRAWIGLDETPVWNDARDLPYSFMDYPLIPKLAFYQKGVDEVAANNAYAALLCSLHYTSFLKRAAHPAEQQYLQHEQKRQASLKKALVIASGEQESNLQFHFDLLQFSDNLSLYLCLNEPGVTKEKEHPWYREGFPQQFPFAGGKKIMARWVDDETVSIKPFPFREELTVNLVTKQVNREAIAKSGVAEAYRQTPETVQRVIFVRG
jgi:hypothetical protein